MSKVKKSSEVAVVVPEDTKGIETIAILKDELKALERQENEPYVVTDVSELGLGISNIKDVKDEKMLLVIGATIEAAEERFNNYAKKIGVTPDKEFRIGGGNGATWNKIIKMQINSTKSTSRIAELKELIKEGEAFVTESQKEALYKKKLNDFFKKSGGMLTVKPTEETTAIEE